MKLKFILLIAFLIFTIPVMALPPNSNDVMDDYDNLSFVVCIDYSNEITTGSFGLTAPMFAVPGGKLYAYGLGDVGSNFKSIELKAAYIIPTKIIGLFVGFTAGPESDWASMKPESPIINYMSGAGGIFIGRSWTNWGLLFHYEKVMPFDKGIEVEALNSFKLALFLDIF